MYDRVLIAAGGTGGHIFPALSLALHLRENYYDVEWIGAADSQEQQVADKNYIKFYTTSSPVWHRRGKLAKIMLIFQLLVAVKDCYKLLRKKKPESVIVFGGYVSVAIGIAAFLQRRRLIIHEQNNIPGMANKLLAPLATKILVSYPSTFSNYHKVVMVGNPLRPQLLQLAEKTAVISSGFAKPINILVMGGSNGSKALNNIIIDVVSSLSDDYKIWHQAGKNDFVRVEQKYNELEKDTHVEEFISNVDEAYDWCDIVICRAGAMTIAEILAISKPSILIPDPRVANNHQLYNAMYVADSGAACFFYEDDDCAKNIIATINNWLNDPSQYYTMANNARSLAKFDVVEQMAANCFAESSVHSPDNEMSQN